MPLLPGDFAPHLKCGSSVNRVFHFDTIAGRHIVLSFFASTRVRAAQRLLAAVAARRDRFDVTRAIVFGVAVDPDDVHRLPRGDPGQVYFYDLNFRINRLYGVLADPARPGAAVVADAPVEAAYTCLDGSATSPHPPIAAD